MSRNYEEIDAVLQYIQQQLYDPLTLSQLADYAGYSPFHFTRIFKERIGLTPQYYVSSVRLQRAKDLLIHTNLSIRDIGLEIGQQSLGTFTTRFTERVGVSPSRFRYSMKQAEDDLQRIKRQLYHGQSPLPEIQSSEHQHGQIQPAELHHGYTICGSIRSESPFSGFVLIGLFPKAIPEGMPHYGTLVPSLGKFQLTGVSSGEYFVMATSVSWDMSPADFIIPHRTLRYKSENRVVIRPGSTIPYLDINLRPPRLDDPPILISIPRLMRSYLHQLH